MISDTHLSILIVDDNESFCIGLKDVLEIQGYKVDYITKGEEISSSLSDKTYDAVIMDLRLPGFSGIELASYVKSVHPGTACIISTAYGEKPDVLNAINLGFEGFIEKPYKVDDLIPVLERSIRLAKTRVLETAITTRDTRLRSFLDSMEIGLAIWDSELKYIDVNQTILDRFGLTREEIIGKTIVEVNPRVGETERLAEYKKVAETGIPYSSEEAVIPTIIGDRVFSVRSYKVGDGVGNITRDITEEKKTLHNLGERVKELTCIFRLTELMEKSGITLDELFAEAIELIPSAWQYPDETCARIVYLDKEFITGNFTETKWTQSSSIYLNDEIVGRLDVYYLSEMPQSDEGPFLKEERDLLDEFARRISNFVDRSISQEMLRESELRYRTLFDSTKEGILNFSVDRKVFSANQAAADILGYDTPEEMIGLDSSDLYGTLEEQEAVIDRLVQEGSLTDVNITASARARAGGTSSPRISY